MQDILKALATLREQSTSPFREAQHFGELYLQILVHENIATLKVVDKTGKPVHADYRAYSGKLRAILKQVEQAIAENEYALSWGEHQDASEQIYLNAHPRLVSLLAHCEHVVDDKMRPIAPCGPSESLLLLVENTADGTRWESRLALSSGSSIVKLPASACFLDQQHLISGNRFHRFPPADGPVETARYFIEEVSDADLVAFLSFFTSLFPQVSIRLVGDEVREGPPVQAIPTLAFEEVDADANLSIRLLDKVPGLPAGLVQDYDISRIARRDANQRILTLCEIDYGPAQQARASLVEQLRKLERKVKLASGFLVIEDDGTLLLGEDLAQEFLTSHLSQVTQSFELAGAERLKRYKIKHSPPKLSLKLGSGIDFLEGDAAIEFDGERFSILDALRQYQKHSYIQLSDGNRAIVDPDYMARLQRLFKKHKKGIRVSFFDLPLIEDLLAERAEAAGLPASREVFRGFNNLRRRKLSLSRFQGELRPYQMEGLSWLDYLHEHKLGGCLADDMGLGKTIQAIALLTRIYPQARKPSLLVMPRSLLFNWSRELERFAPELSYAIHYGSQRNWETASQANLQLTTYGTLRSDIETIGATAFHAVIIDESQAIKNSQTQTARAVLSLQAEFRLALSGTPVENHLGELHALFSFLNPTMFRSTGEFERDYVTPIQKHNDTDAAHELRRKIHPFILRRLKGDVLKDLPPKIEQTLYVNMGNEQQAYYESRRRFYQQIIRKEIDDQGLAKSQFIILEALLELRQIASVPESKTDGRISSSKTERLLEAMTEAIENGHKCLVFTNFLAGVEQVCAALQEAHIPHLSMTGATANRQVLVDQFQNDPQIKAFVMTLKTGGVGLNLTAADTVFIHDPWWNTSAESQAIDRAHRIGQHNTVFTYRLIAKNSIEEKIQQLQAKKKELVDAIVTTDSDSFKQLSESDIEALFNS